MNEHVEQVRCLICQGEDAEVFVRGTGAAQVVRCRRDGLLYRNPRPKADFLNEFQKEFVARYNSQWFEHRQKALREEADAIKKIKPEGNLLDVGCATGAFFANFQGGNWKLYGIDPSPFGLAVAESKYGAQVRCGTLCEANYPTAFFDIVSIMDALYYCSDPKAELAEVKRILKPDGLLAVEIPGLTAFKLRDKGLLSWVLSGKWAREFANPGHLYYFSPNAIRRLLHESGFHLVKMVPGQCVSTRPLGQAVHRVYFTVAKLLLKISADAISIAGRELYLAEHKA